MLEIASPHGLLRAHKLPQLLTPLQPRVAARLQSLTLSGCYLQGQCFLLADLTQLTILSLCRCEVTAADLGKLSPLTGLCELRVASRTAMLPAAPEGSLDCLANGLTKLRLLHVSDGRLTTEVWRAFRARIKGSDGCCIVLRPID